ncbi:MAG: YebC/PmpR family DNA-binding transcriptional regulator [Planctomycetes bacterium]|nr:YebC/PmpR family DNA-binding transcriptional regulator [Planctomycetota bacterium]
MAGHSHSANIAARKGAVDKKRAKAFTKLSRAIMSAVRQAGADMDSNLKLKYAVEKARAANMPKDNIERVIKRALGEQSGETEELTYEGYAPGGVAIIVACLTENRARTAPDVKHIFDKHGGNLGSPGSVAFLFAFRSILVLEREGRTEDQLLELALDAGADDVRIEGEFATILGAATEFLALKKGLEAKGVKLVSAEMGYVPQTTSPVQDKEQAKKILRLVDDLEDHDDVQTVYANYEIPDEWVSELSG